jgi:two-component system, chemotaxis family, chemotaxis protein CheY
MTEYNLEDLKILIVDDNSNVGSMVKTVLYSLAIKNITVVDNAGEAFRILKSAQIDIVICDWVMKPIDGPMFVKRVRQGKDSPNPHIPIIMLSGYADERRVLKSRELGVNEFLTKPFSAKSLYTRIKAVIESDRKFIKTDTFFGPDRRRVTDKFYSKNERRVPEKQNEDKNSNADKIDAESEA